MFKVGTVSTFFSKVSVAFIKLENPLSVGDTIRFVKNGETKFEQKVESLQVGYRKIDTAARGSMVGLKTNNEVEKETEVFKI